MKTNVKRNSLLIISLFLAIFMLAFSFCVILKPSYTSHAVDDEIINIDDVGDIGLDDNVSEHGDGNQRIINVQNNQNANANQGVANAIANQEQPAASRWSKYDAATKIAIVNYGVKAASSFNDMILDIIKNDGATDYLKYTVNILKGGAAMAATAYFGSPAAGAAVDGGLDMILSWFHIGETSQTELQMMEARLNDQFDRISSEIEDVKIQVAELSNKLDEEIEKVLSAIQDSFEAYFAKTQVTDFIYSTSGNFSYNLLRRYLYSATQDSLYCDLATSIASKAEDSVLQNQYNKLYKALVGATSNGVSYLNMFTEYFVESATRKSINHYYYDYLASNQSYVAGNASVLAIDFASQVYYDYLTMLNVIRLINSYQLAQIYLQNPDMSQADRYQNAKYYYGTGEDDYVTAKDIQELNELLAQREQDAYKQVLVDIEYILGLGNSYLIEEKDKMLRYVTKNDVGTFGNVDWGETIYLNQVIEPFANRFFLDSTKFEYKFISQDKLLEQNTKLGYYKVLTDNDFRGIVEYDGIVVYEVAFRVGDDTNFAGGKGTIDDPYIISSVGQYKLMYNLEKNDKSFLLIKDLDFLNETLRPLAFEKNPYTGVFDGAGHKIKNVKVNYSSENATSLFGYVGEGGMIKNVELEKVTVTESGENDAKKIVAGILASVNNGTIYSCYVSDSSISVSRDSGTSNDNLNKAITMYAGAISGENNGSIEYCKIESTSVRAKSKRFYSANSDGTNRNNVYAGGIVGMHCYGVIENCYVASSVAVSVEGESRMQEGLSFRYPYITVSGGGVAGIAASIKNIKRVHSDVTNISTTVEYKNESWAGGSFGNHCEEKSNKYIPGHKDLSSIIDNDANVYKISVLSKKIEYAFGEEQDSEFGCSKDLVYDGRDKSFNLNNLKLALVTNKDGAETKKQIDFSIIGVYGFDSTNPSKQENIKRQIEIKVYDYVNNSIYTIPVGYNVRKNAIYKISVSDVYNSQFEKDSQVSQNIFEALGINKVEGEYYDGTKENVAIDAIFEIDTSTFGSVEGVVKYGDLTEKLACNIICTAECDQEEIVVSSTVLSGDKQTCMVYGYKVKTCSICGKKEYQTIAKEYPTYISGQRASTCSVPGYSGDICVLATEFGDVEVTLEKGCALSLADHHYDYTAVNLLSFRNDHAHYCTECGHQEMHMFRTIENDNEIICSCVVCGFETKSEVNTKEKIRQLPRVVVSNAYAVGDGENIKVFIDLHASKGITAANFTVNYDPRLTLVSYKYGNILNGNNTIDAFKVYPNHLNVMLAQSGTDYKKDGTILALTFKTPDVNIPGDGYLIEVTNKDNQDKFTDENGERTEFLAYSGKIIIVSHLPGDINGDDEVDLVDAVIVSNYVVLDKDDQERFVESMKIRNADFDIDYADVNLDGIVDIADVVQILRYTTGGYETTFVSNIFEIVLNYNDGTNHEEAFMAKYDKGNSTFGSLMQLPEIEREGFKFVGWFTDFNGKGIQVTNDTKVFYNREQYRQTLYAYFVPNVVKFDANGGTGEKPELNYLSHGNLSNNYDAFHSYFTKQSQVIFNENGIGSNSSHLVNHTFLGWALTPDGELAYTEDDVIDLNKSGYDGVGEIILYAVWSQETLASYKPSVSGYTFLGWTGLNNAVVVWDGESEYKITADITFYAKWRKDTFSFVYNANGGETTSHEISYTEDITRSITNYAYPLRSNEFSRVGFDFMGWALSKTATDATFENEYTITENDLIQLLQYVDSFGQVNLYAVWQGYTYYIEFDKNSTSATGEMEQMTVTYGDTVTLNDCTFEIGDRKCFAGWALYPNSAVKYEDKAEVSNLTKVKNGTITLYAVWESIKYNVIYTMSGCELFRDEVEYDSEYMFKISLGSMGDGYSDYSIYDYVDSEFEKGQVVQWTYEHDVYIEVRVLYTDNTTNPVFSLYDNDTLPEDERYISNFHNFSHWSKLVIPHFIRQDYGAQIYTVTGVTKKSFYTLTVGMQYVDVIILPNTLKVIRGSAFLRVNATEIYMTNSVTEIDMDAFAGVTLQKFVLSSNVAGNHGNIFTSSTIEKLYYTGSYSDWNANTMSSAGINYDKIYFYDQNGSHAGNRNYWKYQNGLIVEC